MIGRCIFEATALTRDVENSQKSPAGIFFRHREAGIQASTFNPDMGDLISADSSNRVLASDY